jgi:hypothetical protein
MLGCTVQGRRDCRLENPPTFIQRSEHEGTSVPELADASAGGTQKWHCWRAHRLWPAAQKLAVPSVGNPCRQSTRGCHTRIRGGQRKRQVGRGSSPRSRSTRCRGPCGPTLFAVTQCENRLDTLEQYVNAARNIGRMFWYLREHAGEMPPWSRRRPQQQQR